jgi:hypothetical protein
MALLKDGTLAGINDLTRLDAGLIDVARTEEIDLLQKLDLAREEIAYRLGQELQDESTRWPFAASAGGPTAENIVADARLQRWHALETLAQVYRDIYHSQLNDRYGKRWEHYQHLSESARDDYIHGGIPVVMKPIPRPKPPGTVILAGPIPATTYFLAVSATRTGEEGEASEITAISAPDNHTLQVVAPSLAEDADGWNLYAGLSGADLALQNPTPQQGTAVFVMQTLATDTRTPTNGQEPDSIVRPRRRLRRG